MVIGTIVIVVIVVIILWAISTYNALIKLRNKVEASWAQVDVVLKRRFDLIPNLVATVKGYAKHESETLTSVIQARNAYANASTIEDKIDSSNMLSNTLNHLFAISEAYPDLKANTNFLDLQNQLKETEDKIQYARQFYNDDVKAYKNKCEMFPSSIIATMKHFESKPFFKTEEASREAPKVQF